MGSDRLQRRLQEALGERHLRQILELAGIGHQPDAGRRTSPRHQLTERPSQELIQVGAGARVARSRQSLPYELVRDDRLTHPGWRIRVELQQPPVPVLVLDEVESTDE